MTGRAVKRLDRLKMMLVIGMAVLFNADLSGGQTAGIVFDWEPFQVHSDLGLHFPSDIPEHYGPLSSVEIPSIRTSIKGETGSLNEKSDRSLDIYRYGRMRLYLSRVVLEKNNMELRQPVNDANNKLNTIKTLPTMFFNSQYRDTFESVGRVFEPQLNLGIEF
jgi:hypothetical protein